MHAKTKQNMIDMDDAKKNNISRKGINVNGYSG